MSTRVFRLAYLASLTSLVVGCSSAPTQDAENSNMQLVNSQSAENINDSKTEQLTLEDESHPNDPFEGFNRMMWTINYEYLDPYLVRPVSLAYVDYTPVPVRYGISNFLSNLDEPSSVVNNLLMGNGDKALVHFNRFWMNSTFGLLGLIDIASAAGIHKHDEKSFSDAIGHYGVGNGPYFMIPGYGPLTTREVTSKVDDLYVPLSYLTIWTGLGKWVFEGMESRAMLVGQESLLDNSPDPYALAREVYIQRRDFKAEIEPEAVDEEEEDYLDDYLEEDF